MSTVNAADQMNNTASLESASFFLPLGQLRTSVSRPLRLSSKNARMTISTANKYKASWILKSSQRSIARLPPNSGVTPESASKSRAVF